MVRWLLSLLFCSERLTGYIRYDVVDGVPVFGSWVNPRVFMDLLLFEILVDNHHLMFYADR